MKKQKQPFPVGGEECKKFEDWGVTDLGGGGVVLLAGGKGGGEGGQHPITCHVLVNLLISDQILEVQRL